MLGVFMCFIMLQLMLREGLNQSDKAEKAGKPVSASEVTDRKRAYRNKAC